MLGFYQTNQAIIWLMFLVITPSSGFAEQPAIDINFVPGKLELNQIQQVRNSLTISKNPKKLSPKPKATCFQANIDQYLLQVSENNKTVYGCIFSDQVAMNSALLRAGLFVHTPLGMVTDETLFNSKLMTTVGGHDFDGAVLQKYNRAARIDEPTEAKYKTFKSIEQNFKTEVLDKVIAQNRSNFIFFAVINTKKFNANITHELLHAQYYNVPEIAEILLEVWQDEVKAEDQKIIKDCLQNGGYDMQQKELLLREFYSYFLQDDATAYLKSLKVLAPMAPLAKVYAPLITKALQQKNIKIISIL